MYLAIVMLLLNTTPCKQLHKQSLTPEQITKNEIKNDENKPDNNRCSMVFVDKKKRIEANNPMQLALLSDGSVRPPGSSNKPPIKKDDVIKFILDGYNKEHPQRAIEFTLMVENTVTLETIKQLIDNISNSLPPDKSVIIYIDMIK